MATGGVGGLYKHSTNFPCLTGDGCRIAAEHGVLLEHMDYVQIHPTTLWTNKPGRSLPHQRVRPRRGRHPAQRCRRALLRRARSRATWSRPTSWQRCADQGSEHVWLSFERVDRSEVVNHFTHIREQCAEEGYDILSSSPFPSCPRSTTSWVASTWTRTPRPRCRASLPRARRAAMASTGATAWPPTACWRASSLPSGPPTRSCATALPTTPPPSLPWLPRPRSRFIAGSRDVTDVSLLCRRRLLADAGAARSSRSDCPISDLGGLTMTTDPMILMQRWTPHIRAALEEDMPFGDVSTMAVMSGAPSRPRAAHLPRQDGVVAGLVRLRERRSSCIDPAARVERLRGGRRAR